MTLQPSDRTTVRPNEPHIVIVDDMIERAARAWWAHEADGDVAWNDVDAAVQDGYRARAREALHAAFEGVPSINYGIGLMLQFFDQVVGIKGSSCGVYELAGDEHGFDQLGHQAHVRFGPGGRLSSLQITKLDRGGDA